MSVGHSKYAAGGKEYVASDRESAAQGWQGDVLLGTANM